MNLIRTTVAHNCHGKGTNLTAKRKTSRQKEKDSRQKEKSRGKKKNRTAKRKRPAAKRKISRQKEKDSRQKEKPHGKKKKTRGKKKNLTANKNNLTATLTAKRIRWPAAEPFTAFSYAMVHLENSLQPTRFLRCRQVEVFLFAVRLFFLP